MSGALSRPRFGRRKPPATMRRLVWVSPWSSRTEPEGHVRQDRTAAPRDADQSAKTARHKNDEERFASRLPASHAAIVALIARAYLAGISNHRVRRALNAVSPTGRPCQHPRACKGTGPPKPSSCLLAGLRSPCRADRVWRKVNGDREPTSRTRRTMLLCACRTVQRISTQVATGPEGVNTSGWTPAARNCQCESAADSPALTSTRSKLILTTTLVRLRDE